MIRQKLSRGADPRELAGGARPLPEDSASRPASRAGQRQLAGLAEGSDRNRAMQDLDAHVNGSPRVVAQRRRVSSLHDGVIQRVTIEGFIAGVEDEARNDDRWDESYEHDLGMLQSHLKSQSAEFRALRGKKTSKFLLGQFGNLLGGDDPEKDAYRTYVNLLKTQKYWKSIADIVLWCLGESGMSRPGPSLGTLSMHGGAIEGRPRFAPDATTGVKVKKGEHRRHIIPWHGIRAFAEYALARYPDTVQKAIKEGLGKLEALQIHADAKRLSEGMSESDLMAALYIMNSNVTNLWPGQGKENSAINTSHGHLRKQVESWERMPEALVDIDAYFGDAGEKVDNSSVHGNAKYRVAQIVINGVAAHLEHAGTVLNTLMENEATFPFFDAMSKAGEPPSSMKNQTLKLAYTLLGQIAWLDREWDKLDTGATPDMPEKSTSPVSMPQSPKIPKSLAKMPLSPAKSLSPTKVVHAVTPEVPKQKPLAPEKIALPEASASQAEVKADDMLWDVDELRRLPDDILADLRNKAYFVINHLEYDVGFSDKTSSLMQEREAILPHIKTMEMLRTKSDVPEQAVQEFFAGLLRLDESQYAKRG